MLHLVSNGDDLITLAGDLSSGKWFKIKIEIGLQSIKLTGKIVFVKWPCELLEGIQKIDYNFLAHLSRSEKVSYLTLLSVVCHPCVCVCVHSNYFNSKTAHWIFTQPHRNDPRVVPYLSFQTVPVVCRGKSQGKK